MDFQSMMETFAEAWVAANTQTPLTEAAAAAADHQNLLLGLGGGASSGSPLDISSNESLNRRIVTSGPSSSSAQSPGLNLSSHHQPTEDESLSPAFTSSLLDIKDVISGNNARNTIPIHCIIERANLSLSSPGNPAKTSAPNSSSQCPNTSSPLNPSSSSVPDLSTGSATVTPSANPNNAPTGSSLSANNSNSSVTVEQDTYAILSATIPFNDISRAVLTKLGYAPQEMVGAKAFVQLRNWKPLTLDQISESVESTIGDIFGDIASFITLRIRLFRPRMSAAHELKDKLLQVLLAHSYSLLANSGSPIDQQILSTLMRGRPDQQELNDDARRRFDQWYLQQVFNQYRQFALAAQQAQQPSITVPGLRPSSTNSTAATHPLFLDLNLANGSDSTLAAAGLHSSLAAAAAAAASVRPSTNGNISSSNNSSSSNSEKIYGHSKNNSVTGLNSSSGHHSSITSSRTRIRTSFDPELELPKLHKWFAENRHPSRSQVQEYVKELNSLDSRKGRKPLDVNNVVYWFKNARAAHKRAELKFTSDSNLGSQSYNAFNQGNTLSNDYFLNGGSPGKASSEASVGGKCNDEPMSNTSRNGSNMDDYYSFDEDGDSHEETQTLDLSMRNNGGHVHRKLFAGSPCSNEIKHDDQDESEDLKNVDHDTKCEVTFTTENDNTSTVDMKNEPMDHSGRNTDCGASSDCNSVEEDSEEESEAVANNLLNSSHGIARNLSNLININSNSSNNNTPSHNPESPEGRRTRRSRTFIDPMSEVPRLESWFLGNTHPAHSQIIRYTDELNKMPYRQKFPKLEPKNIQFWFKNRRAKIKRTSGLASSSLALTSTSSAQSSTSTSSLASASIHNSSALNIERLINAH